jgi:hypothetical protein
MTPDQQSATKKSIVISLIYFAYASPLISLVLAPTIAVALLTTLNFGLGGHARFSELLAVYFYSTFPINLKSLITIFVLFAGMTSDQFMVQNPVGTNPGYYLSFDSPAWLTVLAAQIDIFSLWSLILLSIGSAIVSGLKRVNVAIAVAVWWALLTFIKVLFAALQSQ